MKINFIGKCLLLEESAERVLVLGDLHLGYEGVLRRGGLQMPLKLYDKCVSDFTEIITKTGVVDKLIVLGDLKHEFGYILPEEWKNIYDFLNILREYCKELIIIEGNHDPILFPILKKLEIVGVTSYFWKRVVFAHGDKDLPELYDKNSIYWVFGHGHPAVNLREGITRESYKCFLVGKFKGRKVILVPSFFPLVAGTDAREFDLGYAFNFNLRNFEVMVVGEKLEVLKFGKLKEVN